MIGDQNSPACIMVPVAQLDAVLRVLDVHRIAYWLDEEYISFDDDPEVAFVNIPSEVNPDAVQKVLDEAS